MSREQGVGIRTYDLYGTVLGSDYGFLNQLPAAGPGAAPVVTFTCVTAPPPGTRWTDAEVVGVQGLTPDASADFTFLRFPDHDAVRIGDVVDFHVHDDRIVCHLRDERHRYLVEIALFGMVFALWLERRGTPTLHASVVTVDGGAVGFLGSKGGGKTSTLAACLARGHALLTDDLLALTPEAVGFSVERGFPSLRLWPEQAEHFLGSAQGLPVLRPDTAKVRATVGQDQPFGRFADGPAPLRRLYLPERQDPSQDPDVRLDRLPPDLAVMALLRHSFLPREVEAFGWQPQRLRVLAAVVGAVPVLRLRYPSGLERLPSLVEHLEQDVRRAERQH